MTKQYRSRVLASVHETAEGLTAAGVISKQTMREFDELCLTPVPPLTAKEIRKLREREGAGVGRNSAAHSASHPRRWVPLALTEARRFLAARCFRQSTRWDRARGPGTGETKNTANLPGGPRDHALPG
jgi:hypothetical protein